MTTLGETARGQGDGGRSVWDTTRNSSIWRRANVTDDLYFQYMHFATDVSLNVMCGIIRKCSCALSEVYLRWPRLPRNKRSQCIYNVTLLWRSAGVGSYRPLTPAQHHHLRSSCRKPSCTSYLADYMASQAWWNTHHTGLYLLYNACLLLLYTSISTADLFSLSCNLLVESNSDP